MTSKKTYSLLTTLVLKSCTVSVLIFVIGFIFFLFYAAFPAFQSQGLYFFTGDTWNYSTNTYGIKIFLWGTIYLTALTMVMAVPLSMFTAIYLAEYAPSAVVSTMRPLIELLVGIPSVVYGIFGLFILEPIFAGHINPFVDSTLGFIPLFEAVWHNGKSLLLAATILTIMILPTVTTIIEDSIRALPPSYREASFALGANHWQTIKKILIPTAKSGIILGIVLGMMRAMGETMAIAMLLGNVPNMPVSILDGGAYVMTSKILNDITHHLVDDNARAALFGIAAVLFALEMFGVAVARKLGGK